MTLKDLGCSAATFKESAKNEQQNQETAMTMVLHWCNSFKSAVASSAWEHPKDVGKRTYQFVELTVSIMWLARQLFKSVYRISHMLIVSALFHMHSRSATCGVKQNVNFILEHNIHNLIIRKKVIIKTALCYITVKNNTENETSGLKKYLVGSTFLLNFALTQHPGRELSFSSFAYFGESTSWVK